MSELDPLPTSPYEVLDVPKDATLATIRSAHRKMILQCHPGKFTNELDKSRKIRQFHLVQQAYEILADEDRRRGWDYRAEIRAEVKEKRSRQDLGDPQSTSFAAPSSSETPQEK